MGSFHIRLLLASFAALTPFSLSAQQAGGSVQDFQLDPARDPNRPKGPEREGPEVDNRPAVSLPGLKPVEPLVVPSVPPPVATTQPRPVPEPTRAEPVRERPAPPATVPVRETPSRAETLPEPPPSAAEPQATAPAPIAEPPVVATPAPADPVATPPLQDAPVAPSEPPAGGLPWPWLIGGAVVALAAAAWFLLRRKPVVAESAIEDAPVERVQPVETPPPAPPAPEMAPASHGFTVPAPPTPAAVAAARLTLEFEALEARSSLVAATVGYRLMIRNEGTIDAENVVVATVMANAEAKQEQALARFFASPADAPSHQIGRVGAGDWVEMKGELRLDHNAITPIRVQDKALFIPILAFTAHYTWEGDHRGYSAAAFIVGQESDPPQERMAPFRLDLGPRQFRSIGSRLGQTALVT